MRIPIPLGLISLIGLGLAACRGDETIAAYGAADIIWYLAEMDGLPFNAAASLQFPESGVISGSAPCNSYSAVQDAPYPWFDAQKLSVTRMTCDDLAAEGRFFQALQTMTLSEVSGGTLILSNDAGRELVFRAAE